LPVRFSVLVSVLT